MAKIGTEGPPNPIEIEVGSSNLLEDGTLKPGKIRIERYVGTTIISFVYPDGRRESFASLSDELREKIVSLLTAEKPPLITP